ncbi:MAG: type II secretion system protein [Candidatus Levybacteria bacterium]|nr:type II secretion system protein [Candidatus Levybacteria bacterium]
MKTCHLFQRGQSLIEILVVMGLAAVLLPAIITGLVATREGKAQEKQRIAAVALLQEAQEALRDIRDSGWSNMANNGTFHPAVSGSSWILSADQETIGLFTRKIVLSDVYRNISGAIVSSGGMLDPSTKKVDITVSWLLPYSSSVVSTTYITRHDNVSYTETTETEFNAGTKTGVAVTNTSGGEVMLGAGGQGDWCKPNLTITSLDLPKNGVANALSAIEGKAFAGTGENASGVSYATVNINNIHPPVATLGETFDGYKTNGIFGESGYAYLATDTNSKEIAIIDLNNVVDGKYQEAGYFNAPGNGSASSVYVSGGVGYMISGNKLYSFDLASKSGSRPIKDPDGVTLPGTGTKVVVIGTYAYVAIDSSSTQLQIVDVSDPNNLTPKGTASLPAQDARDIFVNSSATRAYLVTNASASQREFFIVDVTTKTGGRGALGDGYEANGMNPKGVTVVPGNRAIIVGHDGQEYQVINISSENNLTQCGFLNIDSGVNGVAGVIEEDGDAYTYIITGDAGAEFKIIEGGPGGQFASSGTFESATFDPGYMTAFNRLSANISKNAQTDVKLQVAVADAVAGNCSNASFIFVGTDGTSATFFTSSDNATIQGAIALNDDEQGYENPARCIRYKAYFSTTDSLQSSTLYDVTINYSP